MIRRSIDSTARRFVADDDGQFTLDPIRDDLGRCLVLEARRTTWRPSVKHACAAALVIAAIAASASTVDAQVFGQFTGAAHPSVAEPLYEAFVVALRALGVPTETGRFAADMQVSLLNDGPVTFVIDTPCK